MEFWRGTTSIRGHQELLERRIAQLNAMQQLLHRVAGSIWDRA
jgi:hypothetical protein